MEHHGTQDSAGSSPSLATLETLRLPDLKGKSFLDLGCGDGFFCDHALRQGAKRVVGVEASKKHIESAKNRLPEAQFVAVDLDAFQTKEKYDVILMQSAFQHSKAPSTLLKKIYNLLMPNGVLVFEGPIYPETRSSLWVPATQGGNAVWYPTKTLWEAVLLKDFSFRYIGPSARQQSDTLPAEVYHCQKEMRSWTLISGITKEGKSSYASSLGSDNVIRIDWLLRTSIANTMFKGDPTIDELSRRLKKTKDIGKTVRWIDTDEKAAVIAKHILRHMPTECDLVIEGYLFSNAVFLSHFTSGAKALGIRLWHSEKMRTGEALPEPIETPAQPQSLLKQTVGKLSKRMNN